MAAPANVVGSVVEPDFFLPKPVKIHRLWTVPINKNFVENYFFYFLKQFRYFATILIILVEV